MKKLFTFLAAATIAALTLTGCTTPKNTDEPKEKTLGWGADLALTEIPIWDTKNVDLPSGWDAGVKSGDKETTIIGAVNEQTVLGRNKDNTCYLSAIITQTPSYYAGRGSEWLSKDSLYEFSTFTSTTVQNETDTTLPTNQGGMSIKAGEVKIPAPMFSGLAPNDNTLFGYMGTRTIDTLIDNGNPEGDTAYGTPDNMSLPTIQVLYGCSDEANLDPQVWEQILAGLPVTL